MPRFTVETSVNFIYHDIEAATKEEAISKVITLCGDEVAAGIPDADIEIEHIKQS